MEVTKMTTQKGVVEAVSIKNRSVKINDTWFKLDEKIKLDWVKKGEADFVTDEDNSTVMFIKNTGKPEKQNSFKEVEKFSEDKDTFDEKMAVAVRLKRVFEARKAVFEKSADLLSVGKLESEKMAETWREDMVKFIMKGQEDLLK